MRNEVLTIIEQEGSFNLEENTSFDKEVHELLDSGVVVWSDEYDDCVILA